MPFYALSVKMMNLLIVFHDLWGMHVDGMSNQEKKDFGVLHDNLYRFATIFIKPVEGTNEPIWQENECLCQWYYLLWIQFLILMFEQTVLARSRPPRSPTRIADETFGCGSLSLPVSLDTANIMLPS